LKGAIRRALMFQGREDSEGLKVFGSGSANLTA
jgi:hypothetical protein